MQKLCSNFDNAPSRENELSNIYLSADLLPKTKGNFSGIALENVMILDTEGGIRNDIWEFGYTAINKKGQIFHGIISNNKNRSKDTNQIKQAIKNLVNTLFENEVPSLVAHKISHDKNVLEPVFNNLKVCWSHVNDTCYDSDGSFEPKDTSNTTQSQKHKKSVVEYINNKSNKNKKGKALFMRFARLLDKDCADEVINFMSVILDKISKDDNKYKFRICEKDRSFFHNAFIDALCTAILYWKDKYGVDKLKKWLSDLSEKKYSIVERKDDQASMSEQASQKPKIAKTAQK